MKRREFLRKAPLAATAAAIGTGVIAREATDPHAAWYAEWRQQMKAWHVEVDRTEADTPKSEAAWDRKMELEKLLSDTPATTREGLQAQVEWMIEDDGGTYMIPDHVRTLKTVLAGLSA